MFEVTLGDTLIYSKKQTGKFPDPEQIKQAVASGGAALPIDQQLDAATEGLPG